MAIGKWVHLVVTYNAGTGAYVVYQDANATGTNTAFSPAPPQGAPYPSPVAYVPLNTLYTDGSKATLLGPSGLHC